MYPNPQDVLPLPPRPNLEQYRKRAKDLVKASRSGDADAVSDWAAKWIAALARRRPTGASPSQKEIDVQLERITLFARDRMTRSNPDGGGALAEAQFVIARVHGFASWPRFARHLQALARGDSKDREFELAADAVVAGDVDSLVHQLRRKPELVRARSARDHRATLLHYVSANGVENYRQRTPQNIGAVTRLLLDSGAEVDAEADVYGGGATTLGLTATSAHPRRAGVQTQLIDILLEHGARLDVRGAGNKQSLVNACLVNGCPEAAEYLADRGAPLDLAGAAGIGRLDVLRTLFPDTSRRGASGDDRAMHNALSWACYYGRVDVVDFLLQHGMDVATRLRVHGDGQTALHVAAFAGQAEVVRVLLRHGAPLDVADATYGTVPLMWALHAWHEEPMAPPESYHQTVTLLVAAGSPVRSEWLEWEKVRSDPEMSKALRTR